MAWLNVMYTVSWVSSRLTKSPHRAELAEEEKKIPNSYKKFVSVINSAP